MPRAKGNKITKKAKPRKYVKPPPFPPRKIPAFYAYESMLDYFADYKDDMKKVFSLSHIEHLGKNGLVPLSKLKPFFRSFSAYKNYVDQKATVVPEEAWEKAYPDATSYVRKYYRPQPGNRKHLKMKAFVGSPVMSEVSDDESVFSIDASNDESDNSNVNLPKESVCAGVYKVCRHYDAKRRYKKFPPDGSERDRYMFSLKYQ